MQALEQRRMVQHMGVILTLLFTSVRATFFLISIAVVSVIALAKSPDDGIPLYPFAPYADILPGQSQDAVLQRSIHCQVDITLQFDESCSSTLKTGMFSAIQLRISSRTGRVIRIVFTSREERLTLGQLVLLWGRPEIDIFGPTANFRWRSIHVVAIPQAYDGHFSYSLPIIYVAFESTH